MWRRNLLLVWLALVGTVWVAADAIEAPAPEPAAETPPVAIAAEEPVAATGEAPVANAADAASEAVASAAEAVAAGEPAVDRPEGAPLLVHVIPVQGQIAPTSLFILRRGLKQAISAGADAVILDMNTPGGRLDTTLEMMELLARFDGITMTFVDNDAISAGAYISMATRYIYFAPDGVMGAAAVVAGGGQEIDESMRAKINSYLFARMRTYSEQHQFRSEVIRAMADLDYVLEIDGRVLKASGELLSLTATEAAQMFGDPPAPLLAHGIAESIEAVLASHFPDRTIEIYRFETNWAENLGKYLTRIAPLLLGLGLLALFVEFKTPGFGIAGIAGLVLISIVFASNYVAGLAGMEAILFFFLGLAFIAIEVFLLPGTLIFLGLGLILIVGSLLWSLTDIWPVMPDPEDGRSFNFTVEAEAVWLALYQMVGGMAIAVIGAIIVVRFLPATPLFAKIVHQEVLAGPDLTTAGGRQFAAPGNLPDVGSQGVVTRDLHPLGEVEIEGQRYQASVAIGTLSRGTPVQVTGYRNFGLLVDKFEKRAS